MEAFACYWEIQRLVDFLVYLHIAKSRKRFCGSVLLSEVCKSLGKKFALKVLKLSWFPVDYLCPDIVSLCRCIYCRMKWHNSCFIGNKIMEKSRKEFNT